MNFIRKFILAPPSGEVASIPSGKLFLSRSLLSPKGALECLYNDSVLIIKQSSAPFCYQLCVIRAYQEGEASATFSDGDEEDDGGDTLEDEQHNTDERMFFLASDLNVRLYLKNDGTQVIRWDDVSGDTGDCYEFIVDEEIKNHEVDNFMLSLYRCLYEQLNEKSAANVPESELKMQFAQPFSPVLSSQQASFELLRSYTLKRPSAANLHLAANLQPDQFNSSPQRQKKRPDYPVLFSKTLLVSGIALCTYVTELRIFDSDSEAFMLLTSDAEILLVEDDSGFKSLVSNTPNFCFSLRLLKNEKPAFFLDYLGLVFNYTPRTAKDVQEVKLFIKFNTSEDFDSFKHEYLSALYSNVALEEDRDPIKNVSNDLRSLKLSSSDSRLREQNHASFRNSSTEHPTVSDQDFRKVMSLNELQSHKTTSHPENSKVKGLQQVVQGVQAKQSSDLFLGAFRKTENGIVFVTELNCAEDSNGTMYSTIIGTDELCGKKLYLRELPP